MEKSFIVSEESEYFKDLQEYFGYADHQRKFVNSFFKENGIEANEYLVRGNGFMNCPFKEHSGRDITLKIIPLGSDLENFKKMLTKEDKKGLSAFKQNSSIAKEFAEQCIANNIVINLYRPRVADYFKSLGLNGCSYQQFQYNDKIYLKVSSDYLKADDIPKGFLEIKLSEYYTAKENI